MAYARDMVSGNWRMTHQGIAFNEQGQLSDGQHRMMAVVIANVPVKMMASTGLDNEASKVVDTGRGRRPSDFLGIGGQRNAGRLIARANAIDTLLRGSNTTVKTSTEVIDSTEFYKKGLQWSVSKFPSGKGVGSAAVQAALAFVYEAKPDFVEAVAQKLATGAGLEAGDPILTLRNHVLNTNQGNNNKDRRVLSLKTLHALRASLNGDRRTRCESSEDALAFFIRERKNAGLDA